MSLYTNFERIHGPYQSYSLHNEHKPYTGVLLKLALNISTLSDISCQNATQLPSADASRK